jgi:8-oxo-dGTP pyrophosphatase MutT (NUDIX family)
MTTTHERSAGVIPYRWVEERAPLYLILHSATVRNPRAKWEFPKGGVETGETARQAAAREFKEETSLTDWSFRDGFERGLSYTYIRRGRKVVKTVTYFLVEVRDPAPLARSQEHVEDPHGRWSFWGTFAEISSLLYHTKIRQVFAEADAWLRAEAPSPREDRGLGPGKE